MKIIFPLLAFPVILLLGCEKKLTAEQEAQKQQLINESLHNMVFIEGGTFLMGDFGNGHDGKSTRPYSLGKDNKFVHDVTLDSFSLSQYRVTWQQFNLWRKLTGQPLTERYENIKNNKYPFPKNWINSIQDDYPASVDWQEAKNYCLWLGQNSHLPIDLSTEAQWEFSSRNRGKFILFASHDGTYNEGKSFAGSYTFAPVGSYPPSPLGLYDMIGNGFDWVNDWYAENYYENSPPTNPQGPENGKEKVARGTESNMYLNTLTINRWHYPLQNSNIPGLGFRCAVQSSTPISQSEPKQ